MGPARGPVDSVASASTPTSASGNSLVPGGLRMADLHSRLKDDHPSVVVWAGGGVIMRDNAGELELLLVRRPGRNDWSFPKGKMDPGETLGQTALREVEDGGAEKNRHPSEVPHPTSLVSRRRRLRRNVEA